MKKPVLVLATAWVLVLGGSAVAVAATSTSTNVAKSRQPSQTSYPAPPVQADRRLEGVIQDSRGDTGRRHCQGQRRPVAGAGACLDWSHLGRGRNRAQYAAANSTERIGLLRQGLIDQLDSPDGGGNPSQRRRCRRR